MKLIKVFLTICVFCFLAITNVFGASEYTIVPDESTIGGKIRYVVLGHYKAEFKEFSGSIVFNPDSVDGDGLLAEGQVNLQIAVDSIISGGDRFDRIVKSERLLDAKQFPYIEFHGKKIYKTFDGYEVEGVLQMHGVKQSLRLPFDMSVEEANEQKFLKGKGQWKINRKDFDVIWSTTLDHGGVVVSNYLIVDWEIVAR